MQARAPVIPGRRVLILKMTLTNNKRKIWHNRGYLPHFDGENAFQFVTFRLADSLPRPVLRRWRSELERGEIVDVDFRRRIESYLDQNYGSCVLKDSSIASVIQDTLLIWDGVKYRLIAWVVMPNHVHFLARILEGQSLSDIMHSIKSYTAHEANKILGKAGSFWYKESFDRYIRDEDHYFNTVAYIQNNPVKARLCASPEDWEFSSTFFKRNASPGPQAP